MISLTDWRPRRPPITLSLAYLRNGFRKVPRGLKLIAPLIPWGRCLATLLLLVAGVVALHGSTRPTPYVLNIKVLPDSIPASDTSRATVPASRRQMVSKGAIPQSTATTSNRKAYSDAEQRARTATILEATRLGIVPPPHREWVGRDAQKSREEKRREIARRQQLRAKRIAAILAERRAKAERLAEEKARPKRERQIARAERKAAKAKNKRTRKKIARQERSARAATKQLARWERQQREEAKRREAEEAQRAEVARREAVEKQRAEWERLAREEAKRIAAEEAQRAEVARREAIAQQRAEQERSAREAWQQREANRLAARERRLTEAQARREAAAQRRQESLARREARHYAAGERRLAGIAERDARQAAKALVAEERYLRKRAARDERLAKREAKRSAAEERRLVKISERENRRGERQLRRLALREERLAKREARRLATEERRLARMATREARRAARLAARMARRGARMAQREARRLRREGRRLFRVPPYWTVEPSIALGLPTGHTTGGATRLEGINGEVLAGHHRNNGLSLRTGLSFSRLNSKIETTSTETSTVTRTGVVTIIQYDDGTTVEQTGPVQVPQTTTTTTRFFNSVNSLDVPILLGYRIRESRWNFLLEAGPSLNLSSGGEAHLLEDQRAIPVGNDYFLSRRLGLGFLGQVSGEYALKSGHSLTAGLRFQSFGGSFVNPEVGQSGGRGIISLRVDYRVRF